MDPYKLTRELETDQFQAELTAAFDAAARKLGARADLVWQDTSDVCELRVNYWLGHRRRSAGFVVMGVYTLAALVFAVYMVTWANDCAVQQLFPASAALAAAGLLAGKWRDRIKVPTVDEVLAEVADMLSDRYEVILRRSGNDLSVFWAHTS